MHTLGHPVKLPEIYTIKERDSLGERRKMDRLSMSRKSRVIFSEGFLRKGLRLLSSPEAGVEYTYLLWDVKRESCEQC